MTIRVSVIIPVYNAERSLRTCLASVLGQTLRNLEVICIDDGSTDGSFPLLESIAAEDCRLKVVRQDNAGAGPARNVGLRMAHGEYVAFMDADDAYPDSRTLERMYVAAREAEAAVCGGGFSISVGRRIRTHFEGLDWGYVFEKRGWLEYSDYQFDYGYTRFLYSTALIREHGLEFPTLSHFEDPPFFVAALYAAGRILALDFATYLYNADIWKVRWAANDYRRLKDLIRGLEMNMCFARKHGLAKLEAQTLARVDQEYGEPLYSGARSNETVERLLRTSFPNCLAVRLLDGCASRLRWRSYWLTRRLKRRLERV